METVPRIPLNSIIDLVGTYPEYQPDIQSWYGRRVVLSNYR